jgi:hypothetical protein
MRGTDGGHSVDRRCHGRLKLTWRTVMNIVRDLAIKAAAAALVGFIVLGSCLAAFNINIFSLIF